MQLKISHSSQEAYNSAQDAKDRGRVYEQAGKLIQEAATKYSLDGVTEGIYKDTYAMFIEESRELGEAYEAIGVAMTNCAQRLEALGNTMLALESMEAAGGKVCDE